MVYELNRAGLKAYNPCSVLRIFHNHCSDSRPRYTDERVNKGRSSIGMSTPVLLTLAKPAWFIQIHAADHFKSCVAAKFRSDDESDSPSESKTVLK